MKQYRKTTEGKDRLDFIVRTLWICGMLILLIGEAAVPSMAQNEPQFVPEWLKNINPADYMLLAEDLRPPFLFGEIEAHARALDANASGEAFNYSYFHTSQVIGGVGYYGYQLNVDVYETSDIAASRFKNETGSGRLIKEEVWDSKFFSDPRLAGGVGEANLHRNKRYNEYVPKSLAIRYKNMIATISSIERQFDYAEDQDIVMPALARLWLDKVSKLTSPTKTPTPTVTPIPVLPPLDPEKVVAHITKIIGSGPVLVASGDQEDREYTELELTWVPIAPGKEMNVPLDAGYTIRTGPGAEVVVRYFTGAVVLIRQESKFTVIPLVIPPTPQSVMYGRLWKGIVDFYFPPGSAGAKKFEVDADRAAIGIKGTRFELQETGAASILKMIKGSVEFTHKVTGESLTVNVCEMVTATEKGFERKESFSELYIEDRTMDKGKTVEIPVMMCTDNLANMDLTLNYDASVLKIKDITKGSLNAKALFDWNEVSAGKLKISFASKEGVSGPGSIAIMTFEVIGNTGASTTITGTVTTASKTDDIKIDVNVIPGTFTVGIPTIKGDCNGDGNLDERDALAALQMAVEKRGVDMCYDYNKDGKVDSSDAREMLKAIVSTGG